MAWLEHVGTQASQVVLLGDLFDFWFEYGSVIPRGHLRTLGALARLVDSGIPVVLLGGNHDWWGGSFLEEEVGLRFCREPVILDLRGRRTLLAHGDGLGKGEPGYRVLRSVLRGRITRWAFRWLHPDVGSSLARRVSRTRHRSPAALAKQVQTARFLEAWALERLIQQPDLNLVVLGHSHWPTLVEVTPQKHYLNAGDWVVHRSYALLEGPPGPPRLLPWQSP